MKTFTDPKPFVSHPEYEKDRASTLLELDHIIRIGGIDPPLVPLLQECALLSHFFTIQSCYGHFVHENEPDIKNTSKLSLYRGDVERVEYRLAYIAFCIRDCVEGHIFFQDIQKIPAIDPLYIQFGSAIWFRDRLANTYVIQVEPDRSMYEDSVFVDFDEGLHLEKVRDRFFNEMRKIIECHKNIPKND